MGSGTTHIDFAAAVGVAAAGTFAVERDSGAARHEHEDWLLVASHPSRQGLLVLPGLRPYDLRRTAEAFHRQVHLVQSWEACRVPWGVRRHQDVPSQQDAL